MIALLHVASEPLDHGCIIRHDEVQRQDKAWAWHHFNLILTDRHWWSRNFCSSLSIFLPHPHLTSSLASFFLSWFSLTQGNLRHHVNFIFYLHKRRGAKNEAAFFLFLTLLCWEEESFAVYALQWMERSYRIRADKLKGGRNSRWRWWIRDAEN